MRSCAAANALISLTAFVALLACTASSPPAQPSAGPQTPEPPSAAGTNADMQSEAEQQAAGPKKRPETVADCQNLITTITNEPPDGGVVMNNANTAGDAGASDRLQPMIDLVKGKRDGFRCCFDIWARNNRGANGRVTLVFDLKPDGTLRGAHVDQAQSGIHAPEVESCMVEMAKSLTYPKSPSGKDTTYTHRFDFKALN